MDKIIVGMDISLDSTGITYIDGLETGYFNFLNIRKLTTAKKIDMEKTLDLNPMVKELLTVSNLNVSFYERNGSSPSSSTLSKWHRGHLDFCTSVPQQIANTLLSLKMKTGKKLVINIEFYSYGSAGSSSYQIAEFTGILKMLLFKEDICLPEDIYVTPGPTVKKFSGSGSHDKYDSMVVFRERTAGKNDQFAQFVDRNFHSLYKEKIVGRGSSVKREVPSPFNDIIDSWWIAEYLRDMLSSDK